MIAVAAAATAVRDDGVEMKSGHARLIKRAMVRKETFVSHCAYSHSEQPEKASVRGSIFNKILRPDVLKFARDESNKIDETRDEMVKSPTPM